MNIVHHIINKLQQVSFSYLLTFLGLFCGMGTIDMLKIYRFNSAILASFFVAPRMHP